MGIILWPKRLGARVTPCGFRGGRNGVWVGFLRDFSCHKFHSTISPHSSHPCRFISFHQHLWWCDRRGRPAPFLFTDLKYRVSSHLIPWLGPVSDTSLGCYLLYISAPMSVWPATLPLPSAVALYMWTLASTSPWAFMACHGDTFTLPMNLLINL